MSPQVAIINYGLGNVRSVQNALEALGATVKVTNNVQELAQAERLLLPGVGAFEDGIKNLKQLGLVEPLNQLVLQKKKPILGICLGMQLFAKKSFENGVHEGLGWLDADVVRFPVDLRYEDHSLKVPHVGWNDVASVRPNALFDTSPEQPQSFYFVHSYYLECHDPETSVGICNYGINFTAIACKDNIFAVQFHPEKSLKNGLQLLQNFLSLSTATSPGAKDVTLHA